MSSLDQYLNFFDEHRGLIDSHAPEALNARREAARQVLARAGRLPQRGDEGFDVVSPEDMFAPDYGINVARVAIGGEETRQDSHCTEIPRAGMVAVSLVNDTFSAPGLKPLPGGVEVMSLARAAELYPERFKSEIAPAGNPLVAINDLFVQDGVYIHVPARIAMERPVQILATFNASQPMMAVRRIVIDVEADARATLITCDHPRSSEVDYLSSRVVEARVGRGASLDFYDLEEATHRCSRASVFAAAQEGNSRLNVVALTLDGGVTRNEYYVKHLDTHCHTSLNGLVVAGGAQVVDNATYITHDQESCTSEQMFKYALFDSSRGGFDGLVTVKPGARFTDAHQSNRNLLVSPAARMHAMPRLVIDCDDVRCSHGSATGQLSSDALFYMRSRGIPEAEARMMLITAFMSEGLDKISYEPLRQNLRMLLDRRLRGCADSCSSCSIETLHGNPPVKG